MTAALSQFSSGPRPINATMGRRIQQEAAALLLLLCAVSTAALLVVIFIPGRRQIGTLKVLQWDSRGGGVTAPAAD